MSFTDPDTGLTLQVTNEMSLGPTDAPVFEKGHGLTIAGRRDRSER
jgi:hypothetical protein